MVYANGLGKPHGLVQVVCLKCLPTVHYVEVLFSCYLIVFNFVHISNEPVSNDFDNLKDGWPLWCVCRSVYVSYSFSMEPRFTVTLLS